jgi:hypothetical protein
MSNHCDRSITYLGDLDISFVLLNTFSIFFLHLVGLIYLLISPFG